MILPTTTAADNVAGLYRTGPFFAPPAMPERLLGAAVYVIGVVLSGMQLCKQPGLRIAAFTRLQTIRAIPVPVVASFAEISAHLAREMLDLRVGERLVDHVQKSFVGADSPDVLAEVLICLKIRAERATGLGHHSSVCLFACVTTKLPIRSMPPAP